MAQIKKVSMVAFASALSLTTLAYMPSASAATYVSKDSNCDLLSEDTASVNLNGLGGGAPGILAREADKAPAINVQGYNALENGGYKLNAPVSIYEDYDYDNGAEDQEAREARVAKAAGRMNLNGANYYYTGEDAATFEVKKNIGYDADAYEEAHDAWEEGVAEDEAALEGLNDDLDALNEELGTLNDDLDDLNGKLSELEQEKADLEAELAALNPEDENYETDRADIQGQITAKAGEISDKNDEIDAKEEAISDQEDLITAKEEAIEDASNALNTLKDAEPKANDVNFDITIEDQTVEIYDNAIYKTPGLGNSNTMNNACVLASESGAAVHVESGVTLIISGGKFDGEIVVDAGAKLVIIDGFFTTATKIDSQDGEVLIYGGKFANGVNYSDLLASNTLISFPADGYDVVLASVSKDTFSAPVDTITAEPGNKRHIEMKLADGETVVDPSEFNYSTLAGDYISVDENGDVTTIKETGENSAVVKVTYKYNNAASWNVNVNVVPTGSSFTAKTSAANTVVRANGEGEYVALTSADDLNDGDTIYMKKGTTATFNYDRTGVSADTVLGLFLDSTKDDYEWLKSTVSGEGELPGTGFTIDAKTAGEGSFFVGTLGYQTRKNLNLVVLENAVSGIEINGMTANGKSVRSIHGAYNVTEGDTIKLDYTVTDEDVFNVKSYLVSGNPNILEIVLDESGNQTGEVIAKGTGTATLSVYATDEVTTTPVIASVTINVAEPLGEAVIAEGTSTQYTMGKGAVTTIEGASGPSAIYKAETTKVESGIDLGLVIDEASAAYVFGDDAKVSGENYTVAPAVDEEGEEIPGVFQVAFNPDYVASFDIGEYTFAYIYEDGVIFSNFEVSEEAKAKEAKAIEAARALAEANPVAPKVVLVDMMVEAGYTETEADIAVSALNIDYGVRAAEEIANEHMGAGKTASKAQLVEALEELGFTTEEAEAGIAANSALNFNARAAAAVGLMMGPGKTESKSELTALLSESGFTDEQIEYALGEGNPALDFSARAANFVASNMGPGRYESKTELTSMLEHAGFTADEIAYAFEANSALNFKARAAVRVMKDYMGPATTASKKQLIENQLVGEAGFTYSEAEYAVTEALDLDFVARAVRVIEALAEETPTISDEAIKAALVDEGFETAEITEALAIFHDEDNA